MSIYCVAGTYLDSLIVHLAVELARHYWLAGWGRAELQCCTPHVAGGAGQEVGIGLWCHPEISKGHSLGTTTRLPDYTEA